MNINYEKVEIKLGDVVEYEGSYALIIFNNNDNCFTLLDLNSFQVVDWIAYKTIDSLIKEHGMKFVESHLTIKR